MLPDAAHLLDADQDQRRLRMDTISTRHQPVGKFSRRGEGTDGTLVAQNLMAVLTTQLSQWLSCL